METLEERSLNRSPAPRATAALLAGLASLTLLFVMIRSPAGAPPEAEPPPRPVAEPPPTPPAKRLASPLGALGATHWLVASVLQGAGGLPDPEEEDSARRYGTLRGRLLHERTRLPLVGVEVAMTRSWLDTVLPTVVEEEPGDPVILEQRVTTDELGRFSLFPVPTDGALFFLIDRRGPYMDFRKVPVLPVPGQIVELGDLLLEERGTLTGRVVNRSGEGVAGVAVRAVDDPFMKDPLAAEERRQERNLEALDPRGLVRGEVVPAWLADRDRLLPFPETLTDVDGTFTIDGLRPGRHRVFLRDRLRHGARDALIAPMHTTDLGEIRLEAGAAFVGRVELRDGTPVAGAQVAVVAGGFGIGPAPTRTSARGHFEFVGLHRDSPLTVLYRTAGGGPWRYLGTQLPRGAAEATTFTVDPDIEATFRVVDEDGEPVRDARLWLSRTAGVFRPSDVRLPAALRSAGEGWWRARLSSWNGVRVIATADGYAPAVATVRGTAFEPGGMHLAMVRSYPLQFTVTDLDGVPVAGATVLAAIGRAEWYDHAGSSWQLLSRNPVRLGTTDPEGRLERPGFWPTRMVFAASHPEHALSPIEERIPAADRAVSLRLQPAARIEGLVTEAHRPPVRRWRIVAEPNQPDGHPLLGNPFLRPVTTITAADGSFSLPALHPGDWILRPALPAAPGTGEPNPQETWLQRMARPVYAPPARTIYTDLELEEPPWREAALAGQVSLDGNPQPGLVVRVYARPEDVPRRRRPPEGSTASPVLLHSTLTDHAGRFRIFDLPGRTYGLSIEAGFQGRPQRLAALDVDLHRESGAAVGTERRPLAIDLRTGTLKCTVLREDGRALAGRMVGIRAVDPARSGAEYVVLSDRLGMVEIPGMPAGDYQLELIADGGPAVIDPGFTITAGRFTMRDFVVPGDEGR